MSKTFIKTSNQQFFNQYNKDMSELKTGMTSLHEAMTVHQITCNNDRNKIWGAIKWIGGVIGAIVVTVIVAIFK